MFNDEGLGPAMEQSWQRDQLAQQRAELAELRARQAAQAGINVRAQSLEAALRTCADGGRDMVLEAARAYEAYLKGE